MLSIKMCSHFSLLALVVSAPALCVGARMCFCIFDPLSLGSLGFVLVFYDRIDAWRLHVQLRSSLTLFIFSILVDQEMIRTSLWLKRCQSSVQSSSSEDCYNEDTEPNRPHCRSIGLLAVECMTVQRCWCYRKESRWGFGGGRHSSVPFVEYG